MPRSMTFTLRFLCIAGVLTLVSLTLAPLPPADSPYLSALSDLTAGSVEASRCPNETCLRSGTKFSCVTNQFTKCKKGQARPGGGLECVQASC
jgi:hypothetical protein